MMNLRILNIGVLISPIILSWMLRYYSLYHSKWRIRIMRIWTFRSWRKTLYIDSDNSENILYFILLNTICNREKVLSTQICKDSEGFCSISTRRLDDILISTSLENSESRSIFYRSKRIQVLEFRIYLESDNSMNFFRNEKKRCISDMLYY